MRGRRPKLPAERRAELAAIDDPSLVLEAALRFLEVRQRSADEVRRRLLTAGYRSDLVDGAVSRLLELEMLDDVEFARAWVESRDRARPRGERALRRELAVKGIDRDVIDEVIADRATGDDPSPDDDDASRTHPDDAAARRLLERHRRALDRIPEGRARRQRAYALLARNGFDSETAVAAIAEILDRA